MRKLWTLSYMRKLSCNTFCLVVFPHFFVPLPSAGFPYRALRAHCQPIYSVCFSVLLMHRVSGVTSAEVSLPLERVTVCYDSATLTAEEVRNRLRIVIAQEAVVSCVRFQLDFSCGHVTPSDLLGIRRAEAAAV